MGIFDLERHFAFYAAYHSHPVNVLIHILFVWPIFFTALILGSFTPAIAQLPLSAGILPFQEYMVLNLSFITTLCYGLYYILLDKKAGTLAAILCLLCWIGSNAVAQKLGFSLAWKVVLVSQLICWTNQFIGHGVFEKRAPALLDNLVQAFLTAPFFVLLEVLQMLFNYEPYPGFRKTVRSYHDIVLMSGFCWLQVLQMLFNYEPYPGFRKTVRSRVAANIKDWRAKKQKKSA